MQCRRTYLNAVILPTGDVFIVGGSCTDPTNTANTSYAPVFFPELYSPGQLHTDSGSTTW